MYYNNAEIETLSDTIPRIIDYIRGLVVNVENKYKKKISKKNIE